MHEKALLGLNKKSLELFYNGGSIWCEHLDSMYEYSKEVVEKFKEDAETFCKPSRAGFLIINLDETDITREIIEVITNMLVGGEKQFMRVAFVGVCGKYKRRFKEHLHQAKFMYKFLDDYEKAKMWVLPQ